MYSTVHPHGRGEHVNDGDIHVTEDGSSPRAWGTPARQQFRQTVTRFIPTGVGNTQKMPAWGLLSSVHPHGRGEHWSVYFWVLLPSGSSPRAWGTLSALAGKAGNSYGSSPRAWGTRQMPMLLRLYPWFIPTGVGNTAQLFGAHRRAAVHPHGRGEHSGAFSLRLPTLGSSPRAWGTRVYFDIFCTPLRFIPTGVGNTLN